MFMKEVFMSIVYEISLWDRINMPGREIAVVMTETPPAIGQVLSGIMFPDDREHTKDVRILHVWPTGAKIEFHLRYTAIVDKV